MSDDDMSDPLRHPGRTLKSWGITILTAVILYNLAYAIIAPYFPLLGKVIAGAMVIIVVVGTVWLVVNLVSRIGGGGGGSSGDTWNG